MLIPKRSSPFSKLNIVQEVRRRAAMYQSRRMYEELDQWWTVGVDSGFTFGGGFNSLAGAGPVQMRLDPTGMVHVRGVVQSNSGGGSTGVILYPDTWGPVESGGYIRVPCFLTVLTGASPGSTTAYYANVFSDRIGFPGTAGYFGGALVTSYRVDLGHMTWRREP